MNEEIGKMAREAHEKYPFYRWYYDKMGVNPQELEEGKIPVIDRFDFFEYEDEKGVPYYLFEGLDPKDPGLFLARTTGTMGRPLQMIFSRQNTVWDSGLNIRLADLMKKEGLRILYPEETSEHIRNLSSLKADFVKLFLPKGSLEEKLSYLREARPNVIVDITTDIVRYFVKNNVNLADYGVKYILYLRMEPSLKELLRSQGLTLVSMFAGLDAGLVAHECPMHEERKHLYNTDAFYEVLTDEGVVSETGEGLLVGTVPFQPFPLVRYTNRDRVRLSESHCDCGYRGRDFTFFGREHSVKVPTVDEVAINYEKVFEVFMDKPYADRVMTALMDVEEEGAPKNILATFIECEVKEPKLDKQMSVEVMWVGSGNVYEKHLSYLPVIYVPRDTIPWTRLGRIKSFTKLTSDCSKETAALYGHFIDIVEKVTPWHVVRPG